MGASPRTLLGVFAALIILFSGTIRVTQAYRQERRDRAQEHFQNGKSLAAKGELPEAIEQYRAALGLMRQSREYRQALALALVEAGRPAEAEVYLQQILGNDPTNGVANLMLARVRVLQGNTAEAERYYNRAIYGLWPSDANKNRLAARFEYVDLLSRSASPRQVEAALLELLAEAPDDLETRKRIAELFLRHGAPTEAAHLYQELLKTNDQDPDLWAGLGQAEFVQTNYVQAQAAFRSALQFRPKDPSLIKSLSLCDEIVSMDPTLRRLSSYERLRRSRRLIERAAGTLSGCLPEERPGDSGELLDRAEAAMKERVPAQERGKRWIGTSISREDLWKARETLCGSVDRSDQALGLVLAKLSR